MSLTIEPAATTLGAVVRGVQLARLDAGQEEWRAIEDAFHEHAVLLFPGQHLTSATRRPSAAGSERSIR